MKKRLFIFFLIILIIFGTIVTVNSQGKSPEKVVIHFMDALNEGDFDATTNYFTDDIIIYVHYDELDNNLFDGIADAKYFMRHCIGLKLEIKAKIITVLRDKVFTKSKIKYQNPNDNTPGTIDMFEVYTIQKNKIKSFVSIKINED